jgi:hypothetical protein
VPQRRPRFGRPTPQARLIQRHIAQSRGVLTRKSQSYSAAADTAPPPNFAIIRAISAAGRGKLH